MNQTFIAFDFGTKKIGVAVGQTITSTASPLAALSTTKGALQWEPIASLIEQWNPAGFVVGIPINMDASYQAITRKAKAFALALKAKFHLPVYEMDERLTTIAAKQQLFELGGFKALKDISVDSFAAKLILEAWLRENITY